MPKIINIPDFMEVEISGRNLNSLEIFFLLIKSRVLILIFKFTKEKIFCKLFNLIYKSNGKIFYENNFYYKIIDNEKFYYPNKRITRLVVDYQKHFNNLLESYCLNVIQINKDDTVVDCGANVGELEFALRLKNIKTNYVAFEPDIKAFKCLEKNILENKNIFNFALADKEGVQSLYLDTDGGNTSLSNFGSSEVTEIKTKKLDSLQLKNIKLLKIDAEGYEPEVIAGSKNTLSEIEYIAVDYGHERGLNEDSTMVSVLNLLYKSNFKLIKDSSIRKIGLFQNQSKV
tara:strand:- start:2535 stop:3395 length:861 start_codon:yes stop_codon:yes gene_type:complete